MIDVTLEPPPESLSAVADLRDPPSPSAAKPVAAVDVPAAVAAPPSVHTAGPDVIDELSEALRRPGVLDDPSLRRARPLDVQYWACWTALTLAAALSTALVLLG